MRTVLGRFGESSYEGFPRILCLPTEIVCVGPEMNEPRTRDQLHRAPHDVA